MKFTAMLLRRSATRHATHWQRASRRALSGAASPAATYSKGRAVLGIITGGATVLVGEIVMLDLFQSITQAGVAAAALGCGVNRLISPQISLMGMVRRFALFCATGALGGAAVMYQIAKEVPLTPEEKAKAAQEIQRYMTELKLDSGLGKITMESLLQVSKMVWIGVEMEAPKSGPTAFPQDEQGRSMLTRKAAEKWLAAHPDEFGKLKVEMPKEAVMQIFSLADVNNDGNISFPEFYRALCLIYFYDKDKGVRAESCFEALDLNNDGKISKSELLHFVKLLKKAGGIPPNDAVLVSLSGEFRPTTASEITEKWMKQFDIDHDSSISREEFCKMAQVIDFTPAVTFPFRAQ